MTPAEAPPAAVREAGTKLACCLCSLVAWYRVGRNGYCRNHRAEAVSEQTAKHLAYVSHVSASIGAWLDKKDRAARGMQYRARKGGYS